MLKWSTAKVKKFGRGGWEEAEGRGSRLLLLGGAASPAVLLWAVLLGLLLFLWCCRSSFFVSNLNQLLKNVPRPKDGLFLCQMFTASVARCQDGGTVHQCTGQIKRRAQVWCSRRSFLSGQARQNTSGSRVSGRSQHHARCSGSHVRLSQRRGVWRRWWRQATNPGSMVLPGLWHGGTLSLFLQCWYLLLGDVAFSSLVFGDAAFPSFFCVVLVASLRQ